MSKLSRFNKQYYKNDEPSASYVCLIRPDVPDERLVRTDELDTVLWVTLERKVFVLQPDIPDEPSLAGKYKFPL